MVTSEQPVSTRLSDVDVILFNEGTHRTLAKKLGAQVEPGGGVSWCGLPTLGPSP